MLRTPQDILKKDPSFKKEIHEILRSGANLPSADRAGISRSAVTRAMVGPVSELPRAEAQIMLHLRPALLIRNNQIATPDSGEMRKRLLPFIAKIEARIPSVGRIDFLKLGRTYGGTGWMISEDILVTNRHVVDAFAEKNGRRFVFRKNPLGETVEAFIDFKEEYMGKNKPNNEFEVELERVLYVASGKNSPDIAFLKVKRHRHLPPPIPLSDKALKKNAFISVVGYPGEDPDGIISDRAALNVFSKIYEVKRCSPGEVIQFPNSGWYFFHDCTTLGGNSGSVVLDNMTGAAIGLHFMGEVQKENFAVKASEVIKQLRKVSRKVYIEKTPKIVPVKLTGRPEVPQNYDDREGYEANFLGVRVPLPSILKNKNDILTLNLKPKGQTELKYEHFSVVMNKKRRMCFFSACNIDGEQSKRGVARVAWKMDSRVPKKTQIKEECYGNPPLFSRGHMTRKEDPIWGSLARARVACGDTFHVTNACPQLQPFNAPIWLALEDYALENARQDNMKISVFTGPIFNDDDPIIEGVCIPVEFFKIIAFIHDRKKTLCATGYTVSQKEQLSKNEFVYGPFLTYQRSIKTIERLTGLKFGPLASVDGRKGQETIGTPLASFEDIQFVSI